MLFLIKNLYYFLSLDEDQRFKFFDKYDQDKLNEYLEQ